jgi:hypothetical protein
MTTSNAGDDRARLTPPLNRAGILAVIRHIALLAMILQFAIGAAAQIPNSQHVPLPAKPASGLQVVESAARASLENTAIHVTLPFNLPAPRMRPQPALSSPLSFMCHGNRRLPVKLGQL